MSEEIKGLLRTYQRGLNEANLDLVRSVYAKDAVVIGQPFPTATGIEAIIALYTDFLSKLDFNVQFDLLEMELGNDLGFIRTRSHGTIVPKGQKPTGSEGNREIFIVKRIQDAWKFYRYIFNAEVAG
jgi:ketosteroid isomerase-like protein